MASPSTRREFIHASAALATSALYLPSFALGQQPKKKLRLASIGVGGMGAADLGQFGNHPNVEIVGLCDIDAGRLADAAIRVPGASTFSDWRKMLGTLATRIDAVNVATPDHSHAPVTMTAIRLGKHVYCQKPLTHTVHEARQLRLAAAENKVVTQMGIQIHSSSEYRAATQTVRAGALGKIEEVHSWSNKNWGYAGEEPHASDAPASIDWDLWLGTAPKRQFASGHYHPGNWRRWLDFGCGTMGDMGIHILDPVASAVDLDLPLSILSKSPKPVPKRSHAVANQVEYRFAGTQQVAEDFKLTWYDGGLSPSLTDWPVGSLPAQGSMFKGTKGWMLLPHIASPQLFERRALEGGALQDKDPIPFDIPKPTGANHYHQWVDACLGKGKTTAGFDYSGPLTELLLLGVIANRFPGELLEFDARNATIPNHTAAAAMLRNPYRTGWEIDGL